MCWGRGGDGIWRGNILSYITTITVIDVAAVIVVVVKAIIIVIIIRGCG